MFIKTAVTAMVYFLAFIIGPKLTNFAKIVSIFESITAGVYTSRANFLHETTMLTLKKDNYKFIKVKKQFKRVTENINIFNK
jgi:hypothetical protein